MNVTNSDLDEIRYAKNVIEGKVEPTVFEAPLRSFRDMAEKFGFVAVVSCIPNAYSVYSHSAIFENERIGERMHQFSYRQREWLAATAQKLDMIFIDTVPAFVQAAKLGPLTHFPANRHLTVAGHRVVAEALSDRLRHVPALRRPTDGASND
jgi:hypothetical protein